MTVDHISSNTRDILVLEGTITSARLLRLFTHSHYETDTFRVPTPGRVRGFRKRRAVPGAVSVSGGAGAGARGGEDFLCEGREGREGRKGRRVNR